MSDVIEVVIEQTTVEVPVTETQVVEVLQGSPGPGVPPGGDSGYILAKASATSYDTEWIENYTSSVKHVVKAAQALTKGQAVYVSSATGTNMLVSKASNNAENTSSKTMGLVASTVGVNAQTFLITEGLLAGINTTGATVGDPVWLGVDGGLLYGLANKPHYPAHLVFIGIVTRVNANNGEIFVRVQNGFELEELHNVDITNPQVGDVLTFNGSAWVNQPIGT